MICHVCNKLIEGYPLKDNPGWYARDCHLDNLYSTYYNEEIVGYVLHWKNSEGPEYKINSSKVNASITQIYTVERLAHGYDFATFDESETLIFQTNAYIDLPMIDDKPRPDLLIPRLLKLKAFS